MNASSNTGRPDDGDWPDFDARQFARQTMFAIEASDDDDHVDQLRLIRIEQCVAARWPRRWLLWARLRREIRASVATWDERYIPKNDFYARRLEWAGQQSIELRAGRRGRQAERQAEDDAQQRDETGPQDGGADPAEWFLP